MTPTKFPKTLSVAETITLTLRVALEHHDRGQMREAAALYQEVLGMDPAHADALFLLGLIQVKMGNQHVAVQLLRAAVHARPEAAHMHRALADVLLKADRVAAALHCFWRILALEPTNPLSYVQVADTLVKLKPDGGNDTSAGSCYQRALLLNAGCAPARIGVGHIEMRAGRMANAEQQYRAAIAADGQVSAYHEALADVLHGQRQYTGAADAYRRAIVLQPASPSLLDKLGVTMEQLGQRLRADACHERAVELRAAAERASRRNAWGVEGVIHSSAPAGGWSDDAVPLAVTLRAVPGGSSTRGVPVQ